MKRLLSMTTTIAAMAWAAVVIHPEDGSGPE